MTSPAVGSRNGGRSTTLPSAYGVLGEDQDLVEEPEGLGRALAPGGLTGRREQKGGAEAGGDAGGDSRRRGWRG